MWQIFVAKYLRLIYSLYSLALRFDVGGIRVFSLETTTTTHASKNKWHELALFVYITQLIIIFFENLWPSEHRFILRVCCALGC